MKPAPSLRRRPDSRVCSRGDPRPQRGFLSRFALFAAVACCPPAASIVLENATDNDAREDDTNEDASSDDNARFSRLRLLWKVLVHREVLPPAAKGMFVSVQRSVAGTTRCRPCRLNSGIRMNTILRLRPTHIFVRRPLLRLRRRRFALPRKPHPLQTSLPPRSVRQRSFGRSQQTKSDGRVGRGGRKAVPRHPRILSLEHERSTGGATGRAIAGASFRT